MPPTVRRQQPPKPESNNQPLGVDSGSMLANCVPVTALQRSFVNVCIYGRNRSGKTTLAAQAVKKHGPVLCISCEPDTNGGADSIANIEGIYLQRVSHKLLGQNKNGQWVDAEDPSCVRRDKVKGCAKIVALANELTDTKHPFGAVVFDTVTSLQDLALVELLGLPKVPDQMGWGTVPDGTYPARAEKFKATLRPLIDVNNCHKFFLAQEKDHNSSEDRGGKRKLLHTTQQDSFMGPALGSGTANWLQDACGYVIQIFEEFIKERVEVPQTNPDGSPGKPAIEWVPTNIRQRHLRLLYHPNFAAGGRMMFSRDIPEFVTAPDPEGLYKALARYIPALG